MSTTTVQDERCRICGGLVEQRGRGRWSFYHVNPALGTVRGLPPHFAVVAS